MGAALEPSQILQALLTIPQQEDVELCPIGNLEQKKACPLPFFEAADFIEMDESPIRALKEKKEASMLIGLRLLREGKINALISAGSTPALVLGSKTILSTLPTIKRPALFSHFPTKKNPVAVLDLGANVECKAMHYVHFAKMAASYLRLNGVMNPRLGLLNIGEESSKGTYEIRKAYKELQDLKTPPFEFLGNIEGTCAFDGTVDALITDGFTGNIFLKTAEGMANLILDRLSENSDAKFADLQKHLHYAEYPGALLLGVNGVVIKSHGYSSKKAIINAVQGAITLVKKDFLKSFTEQLKNNSYL